MTSSRRRPSPASFSWGHLTGRSRSRRLVPSDSSTMMNRAKSGAASVSATRDAIDPLLSSSPGFRLAAPKLYRSLVGGAYDGLVATGHGNDVILVMGNGSNAIDAGAGDDFVTDVINIIAREGIRVRGFRTEIPTLEDVFLKLTGHGIRD